VLYRGFISIFQFLLSPPDGNMVNCGIVWLLGVEEALREVWTGFDIFGRLRKLKLLPGVIGISGEPGESKW